MKIIGKHREDNMKTRVKKTNTKPSQVGKTKAENTGWDKGRNAKINSRKDSTTTGSADFTFPGRLA